MIAVPDAGDAFAGVSWEPLIVAFNWTTWADVIAASPAKAPANNKPRKGKRFMGIGVGRITNDRTRANRTRFCVTGSKVLLNTYGNSADECGRDEPATCAAGRRVSVEFPRSAREKDPPT
jgi:hypothetical protein